MLILGDCLDVLGSIDANSVHACVTDPPYDLTNRTPDVFKCDACGRVLGGRDGKPDVCPRCGGVLHRQRTQGASKGFMSQTWDGTGIAFRPETWAKVARVLRPGAYLLAFGGTRTYHRMTCAIEDAGFIVRDCLMWVHAQGFPKSLNLGDGRGTALKPSFEPIVLAQKPLDGTYRQNYARWGCGALNIDEARINPGTAVPGGGNGQASHGGRYGSHETNGTRPLVEPHAAGRWPANTIFSHADGCEAIGTRRVKGGNDPRRADGSKSGHNFHDFQNKHTHDDRPCTHTGYAAADGTEEVVAWRCVEGCPVAELDRQSGERKSPRPYVRANGGDTKNIYGPGFGEGRDGEINKSYGDTGGASRFFFVAKPSRAERERGLTGMPTGNVTTADKWAVNDRRAGTARQPTEWQAQPRANTHPCVKPVALLKHLLTLVSVPGDVVLDLFFGSGSLGVACIELGIDFIGIEQDEAYMSIARARCLDAELRKEAEQAIPLLRYAGIDL